MDDGRSINFGGIFFAIECCYMLTMMLIMADYTCIFSIFVVFPVMNRVVFAK
jgi:hypothetical protein